VLQKFITAKELNVNNSHTYANDCYAAFPAIEQAIGSIFNPYNNTQAVTLAHIELNSFHIDITNSSPENLIKMSLFGDGAIHYKLSTHKILNSLQLLPFLNKLFYKSEYLLNSCIENAIWAIHPGGPKIVQFIKDKLSLSDEQVKFSYQILKENGNMSSATLPYIWQKIIDDESINSGQMVVSLAFGPGLTVYGAIMKKF